jgi:cell division protein FtsB
MGINLPSWEEFQELVARIDRLNGRMEVLEQQAHVRAVEKPVEQPKPSAGDDLEAIGRIATASNWIGVTPTLSGIMIAAHTAAMRVVKERDDLRSRLAEAQANVAKMTDALATGNQITLVTEEYAAVVARLAEAEKENLKLEEEISGLKYDNSRKGEWLDAFKREEIKWKAENAELKRRLEGIRLHAENYATTETEQSQALADIVEMIKSEVKP